MTPSPLASPQPPIFIVGCPRTGTTLVAQMLDSHPSVAVYLESNYYPFFHGKLRLYGDLAQQRNRQQLIGHMRRAIQSQGVEPPSLSEIEEGLVSPSFEGVLTTFLNLYTQQQGKQRAGEKTPAHYRYLDAIAEGLPDSPVLFLMRDPRDVVLSMRKAFGGRLLDASLMWNEAYRCYLDAARRVCLVRYEELVRDPVPVLQSLCGFIGEEFDPAMLGFYDRIPDHIRAIQHLDLGRLDSPVSAGSIGNYREMSQSDLADVEAICGEGMSELGYERTTHGRPTPVLPRPPGPIRFVFDRLRYYGVNSERWRRGAARWRMMLGLWAHYLLRVLRARVP